MWGLRQQNPISLSSLGRVLGEFLSLACTYFDIKMKSTSAVFLEEADLLGPKSFTRIGRGSLSSSPQPPLKCRGRRGIRVGAILESFWSGTHECHTETVEAGSRGSKGFREARRTHYFSVFQPSPPKPHLLGSNTSSSSTYTKVAPGPRCLRLDRPFRTAPETTPRSFPGTKS